MSRGKKMGNVVRMKDIKVNFYVFITRPVFEANKSLDISFINNKTNEILKLSHEKNFEEIEQYGIVKFVFSVSMPHDFFQNGQHLKYFYYQREATPNFEKNPDNHSRKFRGLSLKEGKNIVIDGLAFFRKDKLSTDEYKIIKCKILRSLIDLEHLWHQSICVEFNKVIRVMKTLFENLCLNDLEYKNEFEKVNENFWALEM